MQLAVSFLSSFPKKLYLKGTAHTEHLGVAKATSRASFPHLVSPDGEREA